jgi:hypothetical protein
MSLNHIENIFDTTNYNEFQDNIVEWLDWSLLEKGNYFNVTLGELSYDNIDYSLLQISNNSNFTPGQAWDGFRPNWVWQSGIVPPSGFQEPIVGTNDAIPGISGVYVDDTFYSSSTTGDYAHTVDYYNGRVIFDNPIPTGSKVQAEYSYKYMNVIYANSLPWIREVSYDSLVKGGDSIFPPEMTIKLPAIAVEVANRKSTPFSLGGGQKINTDLIFHCIAEDDYTRNQMLDIISYQNDKILPLFDSNSIIKSGEAPLSYQGSPAPSALRYPDLVDKHPLCRVFLRNIRVEQAKTVNSNIHLGIARCTVEDYK